MAYNEEANIANAIDAVLSQPLGSGQIAEVIVVASGCTDRTTDIVAGMSRLDPRVRLIVQERRQGKASAINLFVANAQSPVLLMVSADVVVQDGTIDSLLRHFHDPSVGMVGGHPIPVNDESTFLGYAVHLLWRLHDRLAREAPKLGEIVAFRNLVPSIPSDTAVDEISIQALITQLGFRLVYEPEGVVYNHGPSTVADFLRQRRRIHAGHLRVRRQQGYAASTMSVARIARVMRGSGTFNSPRTTWWTVGTIGLEAASRALGRYDTMRQRPHTVWETVASTKKNITGERDALGNQSVLVFSIVNFRRRQLELGKHASEQLSRRVTQYVEQSLRGRALVSPQRNGTIVATLVADREEAERVALALMQGLEERPLRVNGGTEGAVKLACGVIAFSQSGQAHAGSVQMADSKALIIA
jgi:glycosyltransferase involved in cell wall biosynthesis